MTCYTSRNATAQEPIIWREHWIKTSITHHQHHNCTIDSKHTKKHITCNLNIRLRTGIENINYETMKWGQNTVQFLPSSSSESRSSAAAAKNDRNEDMRNNTWVLVVGATIASTTYTQVPYFVQARHSNHNSQAPHFHHIHSPSLSKFHATNFCPTQHRGTIIISCTYISLHPGIIL